MTGMNVDWALEELDKFIKLSEMRTKVSDYYSWQVPVSDRETLAKQWEVVERILDRAVQGWRDNLVQPNDSDSEWLPMRMAALRAREALARADEIRKNLGDDAPEISAANLHPWVWSGAQSLWRSGHYRSAVEDAAKKLNAETQNKLGRRDVSETDLFKQAFSLDSPAPGKPRLRRMMDDGSDTYKSMQRGAMALAEGFYAGIRNPFNHEDPRDIDEQIGLEYLAALSVLARWVDESTLEVAS